ncbi:hypothetical protein Fmac_025966 [Flemingia macrophylla]|uniref:Uncharacterized protein n=1 Tax=Flemingia macrophylla TaxID=520843 RepID=A0ABD1LDJ2_9FABA
MLALPRRFSFSSPPLLTSIFIPVASPLRFSFLFLPPDATFPSPPPIFTFVSPSPSPGVTFPASTPRNENGKHYHTPSPRAMRMESLPCNTNDDQKR